MPCFSIVQQQFNSSAIVQFKKIVSIVSIFQFFNTDTAAIWYNRAVTTSGSQLIYLLSISDC